MGPLAKLSRKPARAGVFFEDMNPVRSPQSEGILVKV